MTLFLSLALKAEALILLTYLIRIDRCHSQWSSTYIAFITKNVKRFHSLEFVKNLKEFINLHVHLLFEQRALYKHFKMNNATF